MSGEAKVTGPDLEHEGIDAREVGSERPAAGHVGEKPVIVVRTTRGLRAVGGRCTHYGGPLGDGLCDGERIHCPWHHGIFDLETGEAVGAPPLNPIPVYEVREEDGKVFVTGPVDPPALSRSPAESPESVVIVGAGAAGATAAETLRRLGYEGPVTLIGDEAPVDRPNLSKDYLAGTAPEEWMPLRTADFYQKQDIDLIVGATAVSIDRDRHTVQLDDGRSIGFGSLLLATGAEPRRLQIPGSEGDQVHYIRAFDDSKELIAQLGTAKSAVVVGAGFIGLEVAASLRHRGLEVAVVEPDEIPLARAVGETLGAFVRRIHEEKGVTFHLGRKPERIEPGSVTIDDGTSLPADLVVIGVGVVPRTALAEEAGLEVDNGVVVDDRLRTSDRDIWAAGDIARYPVGGGETARVEHWVLAQRQGQAVARNMLGGDQAFAEPPFFWSQHYDVPINLTGLAGGFDEEVVSGDPDARDVLIGYRKGDEIRAVASIYRDVESLEAEAALAAGDQEALRRLLS
jgi:NADPH-dependent 2,4-dienoyl-CoA reductase/sulfur reductase-like enzyme/nitrite reductase/ring-hydroxylating ferredoxin subunit